MRERCKFLGSIRSEPIGIQKHRKQRSVFCFCNVDEFLNGGVSDAALRIVDNAQNAVVVAGIDRKTNVCERVLDFLAFVESEAAENLVGYAVEIEFFFKLTSDGVCSHQNSNIAVILAVSVQRIYASSNPRRFVTVVVRLVIFDAVVGFYLAPKVLFVAV